MSFENVQLYDESAQTVSIDDPYEPGKLAVFPVRESFETSTGEEYRVERPEQLSTILLPGEYWIGDPHVFLEEDEHPRAWDALYNLGFFIQDKLHRFSS